MRFNNSNRDGNIVRLRPNPRHIQPISSRTTGKTSIIPNYVINLFHKVDYLLDGLLILKVTGKFDMEFSKCKKRSPNTLFTYELNGFDNNITIIHNNSVTCRMVISRNEIELNGIIFIKRSEKSMACKKLPPNFRKFFHQGYDAKGGNFQIIIGKIDMLFDTIRSKLE
jgi:hypothetical protein